MEDLDILLDWTDKLKKEINNLPFNIDDIRSDFFGMVYDAAYNYYRCYTSLKLSENIKGGLVAFDKKMPISEKHVKRLMETSMHPILTKSQTNYFNRNLLTDVWSTFELCVTILVGAICNDDEKEKLLMHQYRDIRKSIKSGLDESGVETLIKSMRKPHLTHVPIVRKTDFIFNKTQHYYRNTAEDKEFLLFLGKLRNTMHANYIYYGKNYQYKFGDAHFIFENGKIVKWLDPFEPSPRLYFYLVGNLKDIWAVIIQCIKHDQIIAYPDPEQE